MAVCSYQLKKDGVFVVDTWFRIADFCSGLVGRWRFGFGKASERVGFGYRFDHSCIWNFGAGVGGERGGDRQRNTRNSFDQCCWQQYF